MRADRSMRGVLSLLLVLCAVGIPLSAASATSGAGTWSWQNPKPQGNWLWDVTFADASHGWAVGDGGSVLHTTDGGATWSPQNSGTTTRLLAVAFADTSRGWAVGVGTILHTSNGGVTWSPQMPSWFTNYLSGVAFTDASHGCAVGGAGVIVRTSDGGATWDPETSGTWNDLCAVSFADDLHGWAVGAGGVVVHTSDGGTTWSPQRSGTTSSLWDVAFTDASHGWAVGEGGVIVHTSDGGVTWSVQPSGMILALRAVSFADAKHGCAVGDTGIVIVTGNGGSTWSPRTSGTMSDLSAVVFSDATHGWTVGEWGMMLRTIDGGATWSRRTYGTTDYLGAAAFVDTTHGWAVGGGFDVYSSPGTWGTILHTADGGVTWSRQGSGTTNWLDGVAFTDASHGWAVGDGGTIIHTGDGGVHWSPQASGSSAFLNDVVFTDASHGWVVGTGGTTFEGQELPCAILHTRNGGATWSLQYSASKHGLYGVAFTDASHGWAVGGGGIILHTSDAGGTWKPQDSGTTADLYDVTFADARTGWAVGSPGTILHTFNGGATWTEQTSGTRGNLYSVHFIDANTGWAAGQGGTVVATTDGGKTWTQQPTGAVNPLHSVQFVDANNGWVVGYGGTIMRCGGSSSAPSTSISALPSGWVNHDVAFTLTAVDADPGVAGTWYRLTPPGTVTESTQGTVTSEGMSTIDFWSADTSGNVEATKSASVRIDKTPPVSTSDATSTYDGIAYVHLSVSDAYSGVASTRWVLDGGAAHTNALVACNTTGLHALDIASVDVAGNIEDTVTVSFTITGTPKPLGPTFDSVEGAGRYDTAVQASRRAFPAFGSADTIVLATGANWPDALGGASLAGAYAGPLLLTKPDAPSPQVLAEAARLDAKNVVILGSVSAVSAAVESALKAATVNGHRLVVTRVGGAGRYDTAARIASATVGVLASKGRMFDKTAFFATGGNFPDALAASPIAAAKGWPILLVKPDEPSGFTEDAIAKLGVTKGYLLGSTRAVPAVVENRLKTLLHFTLTRLAGATRYDTGIAIARFGVGSGLHWDGVAIATGTNFPDALAGGVMQGKLGSVVLLTPGTALNAEVASELIAHKADIATVRYLGSTSALSESVRDAVEAALK
jgi:photosystem II stability/assembly factor-like uncharacterized protein/putative cell wall-binding protein